MLGATRESMRREFGIILSSQGVGDCVRRWGEIPQLGVRRATERDLEYGEGRRASEYPKIKRRATRKTPG
jgi:hypothetical protein